jgi:hypothetical protein
MIFIAGFSLGVLITMGVAFLFSASDNILDEGDKNYYN